jgi:transposase
MIGLAAGTRIWIVAGVTDLRRGFVGLSGMVQTALEENPFSGQVFEWTRDCTPGRRRKSLLSGYPSFSSFEWQAV